MRVDYNMWKNIVSAFRLSRPANNVSSAPSTISSNLRKGGQALAMEIVKAEHSWSLENKGQVKVKGAA